MGLITLLLLAVALSFDTFAISVSCGVSQKAIRTKDILKIATTFALFQATMPVIGWLCGITIKEIIESFDHWIAFGLLATIGGKMIWDSFSKQNEECKILNNRSLITMALATSIDALSVGIGLAIVKVNMLVAFVTIGAVTFLSSLIGLHFGNRIGSHLGKRIEVIGGTILIAIGIKILIEHLTS